MARWRLTGPHYLNVPGTEWEYKETDRTTGRQGRKVFPVPCFLTPDDPADCNYPGEVIVADKPSALYPRDIIFLGPPTPDMKPLDEEATAITDSCRPNWIHPIESLPGQGFSQSLLADLEKQVVDLQSATPRNTSVKGVDPKEFAALQKQVADLLSRNAELESRPSRRA